MNIKLYNSFYIRFLSLGLILATLNLSFTIATKQDLVTLAAGTPIPLETINSITSSSASAGQIVDFRVKQDVQVNGKTVIKAGSIAKGQIVRASKPKGIGKEGFVEIQIKSVQAVDGQEISLSGGNINQAGDDKTVLSVVLGVVVCLLFLLMKGKDAEIPAGYAIITNTAVNTTIKI